eukprot:scaffold150960_cov33-Tisochrysis_lutea.AAC.1
MIFVLAVARLHSVQSPLGISGLWSLSAREASWAWTCGRETHGPWGTSLAGSFPKRAVLRSTV